MESYQISIVIPCYNQANFLSECLQSVLKQTYNNWEAIVVDDNSTEGNPADVIKQFGDDRIKFVRHNHNRGLGAARNSGFRLAQAQLVLPLDADDRLAPTYLQKMRLSLQEQPNIDCAYPDFQLFGARDDLWQYNVRDAKAMTLSQWIPGPGTLMRRSLWKRIGGYSEDLEILGNEDWDFWLKAVAIGIRAIHIPEPLYLYRRHNESMEARLKYQDFQHREFIYNRHQALFDHFNTGNKFRADGYQNSALAALCRGERWRAAYLTIQAWRLLPRNIRLLKLITRALVPTFLLAIRENISAKAL